ncbi:LamG-like jellyroll fold domain-containing protein [Mariniflexile soesokkakense]|uniref:LamG-like jellyroll fold domain-containing protein n=1 Tax=Mariniflexile soesokkakense TaxID=1343160 RepID=A0ABV0ACW9_9FLAO
MGNRIIKLLLISLITFSVDEASAQSSISFNGITDYISVQDKPSLDISADFTIEAWIKPNDISGEKTILIKGNNGQCGNYGLFIKDGNLAFVSGGDCNWAVSRGVNSTLQVGVWQHVAATSNGNNVNLFINGVLNDTLIRNAAAGPINNDELWIGRSIFTVTNYFFNGLIDEVRIWSVVRSLADIQNNINTELSGLETNLIAYYKLDDIETNCDVEDCSPNENHGTRININDNNNLPAYSNEQPTNLANVDCGVTFNDCITFQGEFQLFVDSVMFNLQPANANSFLNNISEVTDVIQNLQYYYANRNQIVDEFYDFLEDLCTTYPSFFQINQTFDDVQFKYLGSFKEQIYMYLRDYLRYYPEKEPQLLTALDLTNSNATKYFKIWNDYQILVVDNYSLSELQLDVIDIMLSTIPSSITNLGTILFREFYTDDYQNAIYITQFVSAINSFGNSIGSVIDNGFPNNFQSSNSDLFTIALSHEICHTVDADYITFNSRLLSWKNSLFTAAGTTYNEYLRTKVLDVGGNDFFQIYPQEFFASLANVFYNNSMLTLELAIDRFNSGFKQPINQFLLMADALSSEGNTTQFYRIDENSIVNLTTHNIERNANGFISKLYITNTCAVEFTYDTNNHVSSMIVPDLSGSNCDTALSIVENTSNQNLKVYPNPTSEYINIYYPSNENFTIKLCDLFGRVIHQEKHPKFLDIKQLTNGTYFLLIQSKITGHISIKKILKI